MSAKGELPSEEDVRVLAEAMVKRMTWPSMHWKTQSLDYEAAFALALLALNHAPDLLAAARMREQAMTAASSQVTP